MQVGVELAAARQRLGLSLEDVSRRTKISVERLLAIERGDLDHLPALVYLNGFLRAYADEVNLDAADVTSRYLEELAKPAEGVASETTESTDDRDVATPALEHALSEFAAEEAPPQESTEQQHSSQSAPSAPPTPPTYTYEIAPEPVPVAEPVAHRTLLTIPATYDLDEVAHSYGRTPRTHASVAPLFIATTAAPPRRHYGVLFVVLMLAVAAGIFISANTDTLWLPPEIRERFVNLGLLQSDEVREGEGAAALDRESASADESVSPAVTETPAERQRPSADSRQEADPARTSTAGRIALEPDARRLSPERVPDREPPPAVPEPTRPPAVPSHTEPEAHATTRPPAATSHAEPATPAAINPDDLSGWWTLTNRVESTSYAAFDNLNLGYRLRLEQQGTRVSGMGQKWMENGRPLPPGRRTPITIEGTRDGRRLELHFTENGTERTSSGTFVMQLDNDGTLQGRFVSDAANSQGSSLARRESSPHD